MCASAMFNSTIDPKIMNFEPPIKSNPYLFSTSPNFNSLQHQQLPIDHNSLNNNNLLSFNLNSRSPTYQAEDDLKMEFKKKAGNKQCRVCGDSAFYFFYGSLCCDACRTFFRRSSLQNSKNLKCPFNNKCVINNRTRKDCSKCRLEKCLNVGMRADLIVNAKDERRRKSQSINLYDYQFNALNSTSPTASNLYNVSNDFKSTTSNNFNRFSAIQSEYEQYLQSCYAYANAYYMHNSLNNFNTNLLNTLKDPSNYTQSSTQTSSSTNLDSTLNTLNQLNYQSSFLFNNENNSNNNLESNYLNKHQLINNMSNLNSNLNNDLDNKKTNYISSVNLSSSLPVNSFRLDSNFNQFKESSDLKYQTNNLSESDPLCLISDSEDVTHKIRKLSFLTSNDENAKDGFDRYLNENDYDKLDLNKLDLNKQLPISSLSSSSCSSCSSSYTFNNQISSFNQIDLESPNSKSNNYNSYNWKKRKIQYLTDEEIEKENRKVIRKLAKQNQLILKNERLDEIFRVSKRVMKKPDYKRDTFKLEDENTISRNHLLEALKWQLFGITKLCKSFQEITAYKQLNENEKKQLLMSNCTYILMLSSTKYYNFENHNWDINVKLINNNQNSDQNNNQDNFKKIKMSVPIVVMNTNNSKQDLASSYIKFMEIFDRNWLSDPILMTLIFVICLFHPDEKLIKNIKTIQYEHECYVNLLDDYLEKKFKSKEIVKSHTNRIKQFLSQLTDFKENFEAAHVLLAKEETLRLYRHLTEQLDK